MRRDDNMTDQLVTPPTLAELLLDGSGQFNHTAWRTRPTFAADTAHDTLTSMHEWCHHELNNTTTLGLLLTYFATLSRHAVADRTAHAKRLNALVSRCAIAHEVYATWYSVELLDKQYSKEALIAGLPEDYQVYHQYGEYLMTGIDSAFLRQQVFVTLMRSCFEASDFAGFDFDQTGAFQLADISSLALPDERLRRIRTLVSAADFSTWAEDYCQRAPAAEAKAVREAIDLPHGSALDIIPLPQADAVLGHFLQDLSMRWSVVMAIHDMPCNPYERHLQILASMTDHANRLCGRNVLTPSTTDATSPQSIHTLVRQADSEVVQNRPKRAVLTITSIHDLPADRWAGLAVGNTPSHVLVQARPVLSLRQQHALTDDTFGAHDATPVVFIRHQGQTVNGTPPSLRGFVFDTPTALSSVLTATATDMPVGLVSSVVLGQPAWQAQWLLPSLRWVIKIDHALYDFLHQHCRVQKEVRYSVGTLNAPPRVIRMVLFLTLADDEHADWQLFVGLCGDNAAKAALAFIDEELDATCIMRDDAPFNTDLAPLIQVVATHLARDEYFFSFDHLDYS